MAFCAGMEGGAGGAYSPWARMYWDGWVSREFLGSFGVDGAFVYRCVGYGHYRC